MKKTAIDFMSDNYDDYLTKPKKHKQIVKHSNRTSFSDLDFDESIFKTNIKFKNMSKRY